MAESVYKVIELVGTSTVSWEKAAAAAVERAGKSLRSLRIAEATTSHQLTEKTLYSEAGRMIGTPEYMSPEQDRHHRDGHRHAQRRVLARRDPVPVAERVAAVRRPQADHQGGRAGAAQHARRVD